jgi:hypothetical protein
MFMEGHIQAKKKKKKTTKTKPTGWFETSNTRQIQLISNNSDRVWCLQMN